jgi:hypothetical protein
MTLIFNALLTQGTAERNLLFQISFPRNPAFMSRPHPRNRSNSLYRPLAIAALVMGGTIQFIAPALAGSLDIVNKATATYSDGTTTFNATSNTVTITVAEKAGITIVAATPSNTAPKAGDTLYVDFTITNDGGDPTQLFIPGTATLSNSNFAIDGDLKVMSVNGVAQGGTTGIIVPAAGQATGAFGFAAPNANGSIPVGSSVVVRVPIKVLPGANTTDELRVSLGDTATPPVAPGFASVNNEAYVAGTGTGVKKDVYTVDNPDNTPAISGEYLGVLPLAENREAMATSGLITVSARYQAFATVLKANGGYDNSTTPNTLSDDKLTYNLALRVEDPSPSPSTAFAPSDLYGTSIQVGVTAASTPAVNRVLVSDAIPAGTVLGATADITVGTNSNWTIVYTTDALTTTALNAKWVTTRPSTGTITRVGFIYNTNATNATTDPGNGPIAKGITLNGFSFKVNLLSTFTGGEIANIAQVFGQSQPGTTATGTATQVVYDESGDQSYNNALVGNDPTTPTDALGGINDGVANATKDKKDPGTGTDPTAATTNTGVDGAGEDLGGEVTAYTIAAAPFTGPDQFPTIAGPSPDDEKNKDYTNQSIVLKAGLNPDTALDAALDTSEGSDQTPDVVFTNSVKNVSAVSQIISLIPTLPATTSLGPNEKALPDGSTVIIDPDGVDGPLAPVTFTYTAAGGFTSTTVPTLTVGAGVTKEYTVTVNLASGIQLKGYPVIINAFIDGDSDGVLGASEPNNQTIDSYYTGYVKLEKDAQIMEANGTTVVEAYTIDSLKLSAAAKPGRIIKYRIKYTNISVGNEAATTGNKSLFANALTITEDGTAGGNTWFASTVDNAAPVTTGNGSLVVPTLTPAATVTLTKATNGTVTNDIQVYTVNVGIVAPGAPVNEVVFDRKIK